MIIDTRIVDVRGQDYAQVESVQYADGSGIRFRLLVPVRIGAIVQAINGDEVVAEQRVDDFRGFSFDAVARDFKAGKLTDQGRAADECSGAPTHYLASQTVGDDTIVRLCDFHAKERGYGVDEYAGSCESNAQCDERGNLPL